MSYEEVFEKIILFLKSIFSLLILTIILLSFYNVKIQYFYLLIDVSVICKKKKNMYSSKMLKFLGIGKLLCLMNSILRIETY